MQQSEGEHRNQEWYYFEQDPKHCVFRGLDGDVTWGMKRFVGQRMMSVGSGCIGPLPQAMQPTEEIFLIRQINCRWCENPDMCGCSRLLYCNEYSKKTLMEIIKNRKGKNIVIRPGDLIAWSYDTREELARKLFTDHYHSLPENRYRSVQNIQYFQIENGRFHWFRVEQYYRVRDATQCPCCYDVGWTGPRGMCGSTRESDHADGGYWDIQKYLETLAS